MVSINYFQEIVEQEFANCAFLLWSLFSTYPNYILEVFEN